MEEGEIGRVEREEGEIGRVEREEERDERVEGWKSDQDFQDYQDKNV